MRTKFTLILMVCALFLAARPIGLSHLAAAEDQQKEGASLSIINEAGKTTALSAADFAKLPRQTLKTKDHSGMAVTYEGVSLAEILSLAQVKLGKDLKGPLLANCLLVEAADGYRVVLALPEVDPAMTDNIVLMADRRNGQPLDAKHGPYQLVVPHEKRQARWVRQVIKISVVQAGEPAKPGP
jgi:hypothetical protein